MLVPFLLSPFLLSLELPPRASCSLLQGGGSCLVCPVRCYWGHPSSRSQYRVHRAHTSHTQSRRCASWGRQREIVKKIWIKCMAFPHAAAADAAIASQFSQAEEQIFGGCHLAFSSGCQCSSYLRCHCIVDGCIFSSTNWYVVQIWLASVGAISFFAQHCSVPVLVGFTHFSLPTSSDFWSAQWAITLEWYVIFSIQAPCLLTSAWNFKAAPDEACSGIESSRVVPRCPSRWEASVWPRGAVEDTEANFVARLPPFWM